MPVRKEITDKEGVYFITFTCTKWLPLFHICNGYDVVYKWFDYLKAQGHYIIGYVIMPSHVHALIAFRNTGQSINTMVANGKRFMAYDLVKRLEEKKKILVLEELQKGLNNTERKQGKKYGVFEPSFDWKQCRTVKFIEQKLDYMHWNPCKGNALAKLPEEYVHSSGGFYILHKQGVYQVISFTELEDIDLTNGVR